MLLRNITQFLLPRRFTADAGGVVVYALARLVDAARTRLREGLTARFPSYAGPSALALIGADRGIVRGRSEIDAHYAQRLIRWRYPRGHRIRGNALALLDQICEYWGGVHCYTVDVKGNWYTRGSSSIASTTYDRDAEGYGYGYSWDWDGAGLTSGRARFWVHLDANPQLPDVISSLAWSDANLWGGGFGVAGYCWGLLGWTPDDTTAMRRLMRRPRPWKPAGTRAEWLIVRLSDWTVVTPPEPGGQWLHWSTNVAGVQTPARDLSSRYISLSPELNNVYAGDPDNFPLSSVMPDGSTYAGDRNNFPASVTLPGGSTYAGNPATFPTSVQFFDDGDQVQ